LDVIKSHINLYVNDFSISLGKIGRKSVQKLFNEFNIFNDEIFFK
jgi:predicted solute-binding protein